MSTQFDEQSATPLELLCQSVREFVSAGTADTCLELICSAMERYPHAPQPHNLMGIVLEKMGDHASAMKHFRAAWALDPTYLPADHNLQTYGTFYAGGRCAFDESDLPKKAARELKFELIGHGAGRMAGGKR